jgi:hypothetical protein
MVFSLAQPFLVDGQAQTVELTVARMDASGGRKDFEVLPVIGSQADILLLPDTHVHTSPMK